MKSPAWSSLFVVAIGVLALLYLVAIDRQNLFPDRPAPGSAAATSRASGGIADDRTAANDRRFSRG